MPEPTSREDPFETATSLERTGDIHSAFVEYQRVAINDRLHDRCVCADAWFSMGMLVNQIPAAALGGFDKGLLYYQQAIRVWPDCLDAHFAIMNEYEKYPPYHQCRSALLSAMKYLRSAEMPEDYQRIFNEKLKTLTPEELREISE